MGVLGVFSHSPINTKALLSTPKKEKYLWYLLSHCQVSEWISFVWEFCNVYMKIRT